MSRLDSFIRRLTAQRDILNAIAGEVREIDGALMEVGLGNGRTYDHLRSLFPERRIVAFDRALNAHGLSVPPGDDLILGEIRDTSQPFMIGKAALVHADIGTGYDDKDAVTLTWLPDAVAGMLVVGGVAASGLPLVHRDLEAMTLPETVREGRYFLYRRR